MPNARYRNARGQFTRRPQGGGYIRNLANLAYPSLAAAGQYAGSKAANYFTRSAAQYAGGKATKYAKRLLFGKPHAYGVSSGRFTGKFKRPRRVKRKGKKVKAMYNGAVVLDETFGVVSDPHCVYVGHSTYNNQKVVKAIVYCIIRSLFKKAGIHIMSWDSEIPFRNTSLSTGFRLEFATMFQPTGSISVDTYDSVDNCSIQVIYDIWTAMVASFEEYLFNDEGGSYSSENVPFEMRLFSADLGTVTLHTLKASLPLTNTVFNLSITSEIEVQNRTKGADALSLGDADRVDNQPLIGYIYHFKHATPQVKTPTYNNGPFVANDYFNRVAEDGVTLVRADDVAGSQFQEPPPPLYWSNCIKSSKVTLDPGEIKRIHIKYNFKNTLQNIVKKLRAVSSQGAVTSGTWAGSIQAMAGRSQILALEERIRTTSDNIVTVQYERQLTISCSLKTKNLVAFQPILTVQGKNKTT